MVNYTSEGTKEGPSLPAWLLWEQKRARSAAGKHCREWGTRAARALQPPRQKPSGAGSTSAPLQQEWQAALEQTSSHHLTGKASRCFLSTLCSFGWSLRSFLPSCLEEMHGSICGFEIHDSKVKYIYKKNRHNLT